MTRDKEIIARNGAKGSKGWNEMQQGTQQTKGRDVTSSSKKRGRWKYSDMEEIE